MKWLARWFSPKPADPVLPSRPASPAPPAADASPAEAGPSQPGTAALPHGEPAPAFGEAALLCWLLGAAPARPAAADAAEQAALAVLDRTLALPAWPEELLPRASALIPQLLALLRQSTLPVPALAQRISRDTVLSAEVLKLASSPYYRGLGPVSDLAQAITRVGEAGVQTVIARVVLKPIFDASPGGWNARAAARQWEHAEWQAAATADAAREAGLSGFDGYLAGLLHGAGWTVALRALDKAGAAPALPPSSAFAEAFAERAHRLFGRAAARWPITPGFDAFAAEACHGSLQASASPLARAFATARPRALAALLTPQGDAPAA